MVECMLFLLILNWKGHKMVNWDFVIQGSRLTASRRHKRYLAGWDALILLPPTFDTIILSLKI